jgi:hypothetical protein
MVKNMIVILFAFWHVSLHSSGPAIVTIGLQLDISGNNNNKKCILKCLLTAKCTYISSLFVSQLLIHVSTWFNENKLLYSIFSLFGASNSNCVMTQNYLFPHLISYFYKVSQYLWVKCIVLLLMTMKPFLSTWKPKACWPTSSQSEDTRKYNLLKKKHKKELVEW